MELHLDAEAHSRPEQQRSTSVRPSTMLDWDYRPVDLGATSRLRPALATGPRSRRGWNPVEVDVLCLDTHRAR
jgi:hypothetical protein